MALAPADSPRIALLGAGAWRDRSRGREIRGANFTRDASASVMLALAIAATVRIGVFGLFHPVELEVKAGARAGIGG